MAEKKLNKKRNYQHWKAPVFDLVNGELWKQLLK